MSATNRESKMLSNNHTLINETLVLIIQAFSSIGQKVLTEKSCSNPQKPERKRGTIRVCVCERGAGCTKRNMEICLVLLHGSSIHFQCLRKFVYGNSDIYKKKGINKITKLMLNKRNWFMLNCVLNTVIETPIWNQDGVNRDWV